MGHEASWILSVDRMIMGIFSPTSAFMISLGGLRRSSQEKTTTGHGEGVAEERKWNFSVSDEKCQNTELGGYVT